MPQAGFSNTKKPARGACASFHVVHDQRVAGDWLDVDEDDVELLYASRLQSTPEAAGADASTARAKPE